MFFIMVIFFYKIFYVYKEIYSIYGFFYVLIKLGKDKGICKCYLNFCGFVIFVINFVLNKIYYIVLI